MRQVLLMPRNCLLIYSTILFALIFLAYLFKTNGNVIGVITSYATGPDESQAASQLLKIQKLARLENCALVNASAKNRTARCNYHNKYTPRLGVIRNPAGMSEEHFYLARLYIQLVKHSVVNLFNVNFNGIIDGRIWPPEYKPPAQVDPLEKCQAITMVGLRRLDNVQLVLEDVIQRGIRGDFIETGVWKGGIGVLTRAILTAYRQYSRRVLLADSFEGIPPSNVQLFPVDKAHIGSEKHNILSAKYTGGQKVLHERMSSYFQLITDSTDYSATNNGKVRFMQKPDKDKIETVYIKGYFKDSLPAAVNNGVIKCLAVLRCDGDLYESTWQALDNLYPYLNQGGVVIVDDFTDWIGSFQAVHDFRKKNGIDTPIIQVYHGPGETVRGVYFLKPHKSAHC